MLRLVTLAACALLASCASSLEPSVCSRLLDLRLTNAEVLKAQEVRGGFHLNWKTALIGVPGNDFPASCRVTLSLRPSPRSDVRAEVWLPAGESWNQRYLGVGNGGFGGAIDQLSLGAALRRGYAVSGSDTGHAASDLVGSWAYQRDDLLEDYTYRAVHETAVAAKALIKAYYGKPQRWSYFSSASNGGRQGLMEALRYPNDYDGIVSGCPAADGAGAIATVSWLQQRLLRDDGAGWISPRKLPAISAAALAACDKTDGLEDGLIGEPQRCKFKPDVLLCQGKETNDCLTAPQVQSLKDIYAGPGVVNGRRLWGFEPGGELGKGAWAAWLLGKKPRASIEYNYALEFNRYLTFAKPDWALEEFDLKRGLPIADKGKLGRWYNASSPDIDRYVARGGKLILWHGWSDQAIPPGLTLNYYESLRKKFGEEGTRKFARLFMAPGLQHGFSGPGPNIFGQVAGGGSGDPASDINAAMEAWVERGIAPERIVAAKYDSDFKPLLTKMDDAPERTRPLCAWPKVARYNGNGSIDEAANFHCVTP